MNLSRSRSECINRCSFGERLMLFCRVVLFGALLAGLVSCSSNNSGSSGVFIQTYFENTDGSRSPTLNTELARSNGERALGLMYRKKIKNDYAMLFVFPDEKPRSFWMKNTYVSLDIIYISTNLKVVSIVKRATPLSEAGLKSIAPAAYVLEVNAGLADKWKIKTGSKLVVSEMQKLKAM